MLKRIFICLMLFVMLQPISFGAISLTEEEEAWLKAHPILYYGSDEDFAPFEFKNEKGQLVGINKRFVDLVGEKLNTQVEVKADNWTNVLNNLQSGEVDFISCSVTEQRKKIMSFTSQYIVIPSAVITRRDQTKIQSNTDLKFARISTVKGWAWNQRLSNSYPEATLVPYPNLLEAFNAVAFGEVDATVQDVATAGYLIEKYKITNLKMVDKYALDLDLQFAVKSSNPILQSILQKGINEITDEEIKAIYNEWITLKPAPFYENRTFITVVSVILILIIATFLWSISLKFQVNRRTEALKKANSDLVESIESLHYAQRQLIDQEKMAALGSLVAGFSHEVNSPLGIIATLSTNMMLNLQQTKALLDENKLSKQALVQFLTDADENMAIIDRSVQNAIELIRNLKTISVDQMTENREVFDLCDYMGKIKSNMKYECRKRQVALEIICTGDMLIDSYPGAFTQIFTNLIMNSLIHGYGEKSGGNILIQIDRLGDQLSIVYKDDGSGMPQETVDRIYEAFFTTKKEAGSTGLGMNIVNTIVHKKLSGDIQCASTQGIGTTFTMRLPIGNQ